MMTISQHHIMVSKQHPSPCFQWHDYKNSQQIFDQKACHLSLSLLVSLGYYQEKEETNKHNNTSEEEATRETV